MLKTARLRLRPLEHSDAKRIQELADNYEIAKTTLLLPYPYTESDAEKWITHVHATEHDGKGYSFAVVRQEDDTFIGVISLKITPAHNSAEVGYWMGVPYWNQGYTSEASNRIVQFGFEELSLNRIYAYAMAKNPASARVMQKIGMVYEGKLRQAVLKWGEYEDLVAYSLLRQEWQSTSR